MLSYRSDGTLPRSFHIETVRTLTPTNSAKAVSPPCSLIVSRTRSAIMRDDINHVAW
jgi:hypothetical protein